MKQLKIVALVVLFASFALGSANAATRTKCTNPTIAVILAPESGTATHNIFGSNDWGSGSSTYYSSTDLEFNGGTYYADGGSFNTCLETGSGTHDLTLKFSQGISGYFNIFFPPSYIAGAPPDTADGAVDLTDGHYQGFFFNVRAAYTAPLDPTQTLHLDTCYVVGVPVGSTSYGLDFENPDSTTCTPSSLVNTPANTSRVWVTHPDNCTWYVHPQLDDTGLYYRAGVTENLGGKRGTVSGGQYSMPFAIKVIELNCTP